MERTIINHLFLLTARNSLFRSWWWILGWIMTDARTESHILLSLIKKLKLYVSLFICFVQSLHDSMLGK